MSEIALSSALRSNLNSLQNTASLLSQTQERLSTGLRVNSAIDNPTSFFTAAGLNNRAQDLSALSDDIGLAVDTLKAADDGIKAITTLVENLKSTANEALTTKIASSSATSTNSTAFTGAQTISTISGVDNGDSFTIQVGTAAAVTINVAATNQSVTALITSISGISGVTASLTSDGKIKIEGTSGEDLVIADVSGSAANSLGVSGTKTNGTNRNSFVTDFNSLRTQIDQLAGDASFKGVNLLQANNDLTVAFNEDQSSSLTISSKLLDTSSGGLNVSAATNSAFATDSNIDAAVAELDAAVSTLRAQSSSFGNNLSIVENRQDFTSNLIKTLETGAGKLTLADTNLEGANLLALQTRQSLGTTALSLASQSDQNVLRLF
ncbi:flagellin N-terminal helical domain-containing protein [Pyruvatibacter sp. HU-CL02332]|uniref:flagellin N-terminal helical domain-containing protein n=1 Tax=Pyruvatibacter sp. HU-CL02332 TaxID=3127650 RepID=UPI0029683B0F|nr:flagellin [Alphaproteobacteria bacterium]